MDIEIVLSDGKPCSVRRLGIYDLDGIGAEIIGPFTYEITLLDGQKVNVEYDISNISNPPLHPGVLEHEIDPKSKEWYQLLEWQTYKQALVHERKRINSFVQYINDTSAYIADRCLTPSDKERIVDVVDWSSVREVALVPPLTHDLLGQVLKETFSAVFEGKEIFEAMQGMAKGSGSYDALKAWEIQAMNQMQMTEEQWANLTVMERARKVMAEKVGDLVTGLETDKQVKRMEAKAGKK